MTIKTTKNKNIKNIILRNNVPLADYYFDRFFYV